MNTTNGSVGVWKVLNRPVCPVRVWMREGLCASQTSGRDPLMKSVPGYPEYVLRHFLGPLGASNCIFAIAVSGHFAVFGEFSSIGVQQYGASCSGQRICSTRGSTLGTWRLKIRLTQAGKSRAATTLNAYPGIWGFASFSVTTETAVLVQLL